MRYEYIAGFGPIGSADTMYGFWAKALGIPFDEVAPSYGTPTDSRVRRSSGSGL